jgi:hypothetical protein
MASLKKNSLYVILLMKRFLSELNFRKLQNSYFCLSAQNDCFLLVHENEFLVETVRSNSFEQSSCARNTNTIFSTNAF